MNENIRKSGQARRSDKMLKLVEAAVVMCATGALPGCHVSPLLGYVEHFDEFHVSIFK